MDSRPAVSFRGRESEAGRGGDREREGRGGVRERKEETEQERCRAELTVSGWTRRPHLLCRRDYCCISYSIQTLLHHLPSKVCQVLVSFCGARWGGWQTPYWPCITNSAAAAMSQGTRGISRCLQHTRMIDWCGKCTHHLYLDFYRTLGDFVVLEKQVLYLWLGVSD